MNKNFNDAVNHPSHYQLIPIIGQNNIVTDYEAIDIISSLVEHLNLTPSESYSVGNALKYIIRAGKKESDNSSTNSIQEKTAQDLMKSAWYLNNAAQSILNKINNADSIDDAFDASHPKIKKSK